MTQVGRPTKTTAAMWTEAALDEIEEVGVRMMSVQSVARRLGVSKGGFYHVFADRDELLRSTLALWEQRFVTELGEEADAIADPRERLRTLVVRAVVELRPTVIVQLMAAADIPSVAEVLTRAAEARTAMVKRILTELGLAEDEASRRAVIAYGAFLGMAQLERQLPREMRTKKRRHEYAEDFERTILLDLD